MDFTEKFRHSLRIPTWWPPGAQNDDIKAQEPLKHFQKLLEEQFPVFNKMAERWVLSPFSLVYRLPGSGENDNDAVLFLAHYDVVPAETEKWSVDPFGAEMKDGFIYGRGSLDMKSSLISLMEAAENLCKENWKPKRDIWFAFGGDEERSGNLGGNVAAEWFAKRNQRFAWILDEGTPIAENQITGIDFPLALVSIAEKGYLSLKLTVEQEPGHSSRPPRVQAAAILGYALCKIAKKPFPFKLTSSVETFFRQIAPFMPGIQGFVMRHARALGPLFFKLAATAPTVEAMLRTTVAITQLEGSAAENVLPSEVHAVVNLRLLEPWTVETATGFIKKAINDERVKISVHSPPANPVSQGADCQCKGWQEIKSAVNKVRQDIPVLPFIMIAITDSRYYKNLTNNIFRFIPYILDQNEMGTVHGHDERISIENLLQGLEFYTTLMRSL